MRYGELRVQMRIKPMASGRSNSAYEAQQARDELWSLKQVCDYLGITVDYGRHVWPSWVAQGVNSIRLNGNPRGALRFRRNDIFALTDRWQTERRQRIEV